MAPCVTDRQDLIPRLTAEQMVVHYIEALKCIAQAHTAIDNASDHWKAGYGNAYPIPHIERAGKRHFGDINEGLTRAAWRAIVDKCDIKAMMSSDEARKLETQLDTGELPELTVANIFAFIERLKSELPDHIQSMCEEVFEMLSPDPRYNSYKTNSFFSVGEKVIMQNWVDTDYGCCSLSYHRDNEIRALDNCFHLLDGKGLAVPPNDLRTQLHDVVKQKVHDLDVTYFRCKWFMAGTVHIWFKRMDLVNELNRRCGGDLVLDKAGRKRAKGSQ